VIVAPVLGLVSVGSLALNLASNRDGNGRIRTVVGMTAGALGILAGRQSMKDPTFRDVGQVVTVASAASLALSSFELKRHISLERQRRLTIAPTVSTAASNRATIGVAARIEY
jgi:hypothetical protein